MKDLIFGKDGLQENTAVYNKTLREWMEMLAEENPSMPAYRALHWFYGFLGTKGAPTVDAGIFLHHFLKAVDDGLFTWEAKI